MKTLDPKRALIAGSLAGIAGLLIVILIDRLSIRQMLQELGDYLRKRDQFQQWVDEHRDEAGQ